MMTYEEMRRRNAASVRKAAEERAKLFDLFCRQRAVAGEKVHLLKLMRDFRAINGRAPNQKVAGDLARKHGLLLEHGGNRIHRRDRLSAAAEDLMSIVREMRGLLRQLLAEWRGTPPA